MSPKRKREKQSEPARLSIGMAAPAAFSALPDRDEKIRYRAYELYTQRGYEPGRELDDWLQAEREFEGGLL